MADNGVLVVKIVGVQTVTPAANAAVDALGRLEETVKRVVKGLPRG